MFSLRPVVHLLFSCDLVVTVLHPIFVFVRVYALWPNYAEEQRETARKNMLDEVAAEVARMAEEMMLPDGSDANADNMEIDSSTKAAGLCTKRQAVALGKDGGLEGRAIRFDDCEHTVFEGKTSGKGSVRQTELHDWTKFTMPICFNK